MSTTVLSSILDGSLAAFGLMAGVLMLIVALTMSEPLAPAAEAEEAQALPPKLKQAA